jgi:hypothetical protein
MHFRCPLLQLEEIAEELERLLLAGQLQTDRVVQMRFKDSRCPF